MYATEPASGIRFSLVRTMLVLTGVVVVGLAGAAAVCAAIGRLDLVGVGAIVGVLCLLASLMSLLPIQALADRGALGISQGFLAGLMMRLPMCVGVAVVLTWASPFEDVVVWAWVVGWYLALLLTEVIVLVRTLGGFHLMPRRIAPQATENPS